MGELRDDEKSVPPHCTRARRPRRPRRCLRRSGAAASTRGDSAVAGGRKIAVDSTESDCLSSCSRHRLRRHAPPPCPTEPSSSSPTAPASPPRPSAIRSWRSSRASRAMCGGPSSTAPDKAHQVVRRDQRTRPSSRASGRSSSSPWSTTRCCDIVNDEQLQGPGAGHVPHLRRAAGGGVRHQVATTASAASPTSAKSQEYTRPHRGDQLLARARRRPVGEEPGQRRRDPGRRQPQRQDADLAVPGDAARHQGGQLPADPGGLRARPACPSTLAPLQGASASA